MAHAGSETIGCIVVESHPDVLAALEELLAGEQIAVVGRARTGAEAIALGARAATVLVTDVGLPDMSGLELARRLVDAEPALRVVLYTADAGPEGATAALELGVHGIVLKGSNPALLPQAIRSVAAGGTYVDPALA